MALVKHTKMKPQKVRASARVARAPPRPAMSAASRATSRRTAACGRKEWLQVARSACHPKMCRWAKVASLVAREKEASKAEMEKDQLEKVEKEEKANSRRRLSGRR